MDDHIYKRLNKTLLLYHLVLLAKYRGMIINEPISDFIKKICIEISDRYEIIFLGNSYR
ncbi:transposase [Ancylomarina sp. 16SWW S1-10-2]|uniref:transposase n=1 Tax=Ancylomarina sp. 16SWW S1-10-2 TaxID=2499681 RepID=UPI0012AD7DDA|nr:hypothetical protein [Ancylomarina sp. 16SWW S1-10-2]